MQGVGIGWCNKETERMIVEEVLIPAAKIEAAKPMRPRKSHEELETLLTLNGLKQWEGWKFDAGADERRYEFQPGERPTLAEQVENTAYHAVQASHAVGISVGMTAAVLVPMYYLMK